MWAEYVNENLRICTYPYVWAEASWVRRILKLTRAASMCVCVQNLSTRKFTRSIEITSDIFYICQTKNFCGNYINRRQMGSRCEHWKFCLYHSHTKKVTIFVKILCRIKLLWHLTETEGGMAGRKVTRFRKITETKFRLFRDVTKTKFRLFHKIESEFFLLSRN